MYEYCYLNFVLNLNFSIVGAKIWNSIPESYRKRIFKKKIQALLIVTLETLDSYVDISTPISEKKGILGVIQS